MDVIPTGPVRGDQSRARPTTRRSGELRWGPLLLLVFAGDLAIATLAWFLVGLPSRKDTSQIGHLVDGQASNDEGNSWKGAKALDLQNR